MGKVVLPISPPIVFGEITNGKVTLPIKLPLTFGVVGDGKVTLPLTIPFSFIQGGQRKTTKLPMKETCEYATQQKKVKLGMIEVANTGVAKLPISETSWVLHGLILEETIIDQLSTSLTLIEDVRSKILTNVDMVNGTDVKIGWFGDEVPKVEIYKKMSVDEKYELVGSHEWSENDTIVTLGSGEYDLLLKGVNNSGESNVITLGEPNYIEVDVTINIPINEKIHDINIEYTSVYKIDINY